MRHNHKVGVVIPALNEAGAIAKVLEAIPNWVDEVVVADNGSEDDTPEIAAAHGATVTHEREGAYGAACLAGIAALRPCDVVVFVDGDYSDFPAQMDRLVDPIAQSQADLVIGSRPLGRCERGALAPQQRFGNWLACFLIRLFWDFKYTDLGPFRAIRTDSLRRINMRDKAFGWTVEMQLRALQENLRIREVPVDYRARIGHSKISGTLRGTILAGHAILGTIFKTAWRSRKRAGNLAKVSV
ncbi:MAG: glycosyltransferase family 2 protein [Alphaproteobacteria bacterium]|nr:glycosyltransferase family 2 protein [Alphaproteobacteria bacterium]